jgi:hypothetical protein
LDSSDNYVQRKSHRVLVRSRPTQPIVIEIRQTKTEIRPFADVTFSKPKHGHGQQQNHQQSNYVQQRALIDTGARRSAITHEVNN